MNGPNHHSPNPEADSVKDIFARVLECQEASDIAGAALELARAEPRLRGKVQDLLDAHRRASRLLHDSSPPSRDRVSILGYDVGPEIGRGGFGVVYEARQRTPIDRQVAVKILRIENPGADVVARFRAESRALARMDHPCIARVLDAGVDTANRPFVALELVRGEPILSYCSRHALGVRQRIELMAQVCRAAHHAHQRAVIHRDLKPGNILVEQIDGVPTPRVIDFGIAKFIEDSESELLTRTGARMGTPRYMSPEQNNASETADVRSDLYALGAVLCELLSGGVPRDSSGRHRLASQIAAELPGEHASLVATLRGDLDAIIAHATAPEPDERYSSAAAMAQDLDRYLAGEPVLATTPTWWYIARKFVLRHKPASIAVAAAAISLAAGALVALQGAREARAQRDRAERAVTFVLGDMLDSLDADEREGREASLQLAFREGSRNAQSRLGNDPKLVVDTLTRIARAQQTIGDEAGAAETIGRAAPLAHELFGPHDARTLELELERHRLDRAAGNTAGKGPVFAQIRDRAVRALGPHHRVSLRARMTAAYTNDAPGWMDELLAVERAWHTTGRAGTQDHIECLQILGLAQLALNDPRALQTFKLCADTAAASLGPEHSVALAQRLTYARELVRLGHFADAEPILEEIVQTSGRLHGTLGMRHRIAVLLLSDVLAARAQYPRAIDLAREHLRGSIDLFGEGSPQSVVSLHALANTLTLAGMNQEAQPVLQAYLAAAERHWSPSRPAILANRVRLARVLTTLGRQSEVGPVLAPVFTHLMPGDQIRADGAIALAASRQPESPDEAARILEDELGATPSGPAADALRRALEATRPPVR